MRRRIGLAAVLVWLALLLCGGGQSLPDWLSKGGWAKPPDFGVRDRDGFFTRNSGAEKRISEKIRSLAANHGFQLYLVVKPALIGTTAPELASTLQDSWLPEGSGLVVVYEADSQTVAFGRNGGGTPGEEAAEGQVPTHVIAGILGRVTASAEHDLAPEAFVESLVGNLADEFGRYFERRKAPPPAGRTLRLGLLTVGALAVLALAAILIGALTRLPSVSGTRAFRFPDVDRPERLGAPCGASVTTRRFKGGGAL